MFTIEFWKKAGERAVKTAAQSAILVGFAGSEAVDAFSVPWQSVIGCAVGGAVLSLLTSVASAPINEKGTPSLV